MADLLKEHVMMYVAENEVNTEEELFSLIKRNVMFEEVTDRVIKDRLRTLREEKLVRDLEINRENPRTFDTLGFLYWSKHRDIDWEELLEYNCVKVFHALIELQEAKIEELMENTGLSRPTVYKYIDLLSENSFLEKTKKKPIILKPLVNDSTILYINLFEIGLESFSEKFDSQDTEIEVEHDLKEKIARIHTYSSTVTEGNTATVQQVENVLDNFPTDLTPREILEIENSNRAVEILEKIKHERITVERIKKINRAVIYHLVDNPGEIEYGRKRIAGSKYDPPSRKPVIDNSMNALENFIKKYDHLDAEILGSLAHFMLVSIHPFRDGNGRTARLLHSWILLKQDKTLFVYNPDHQRQYFQLLEEGNMKGVTPFIEFCIEKHQEQLEEIIS